MVAGDILKDPKDGEIILLLERSWDSDEDEYVWNHLILEQVPSEQYNVYWKAGDTRKYPEATIELFFKERV